MYDVYNIDVKGCLPSHWNLNYWRWFRQLMIVLIHSPLSWSIMYVNTMRHIATITTLQRYWKSDIKTSFTIVYPLIYKNHFKMVELFMSFKTSWLCIKHLIFNSDNSVVFYVSILCKVEFRFFSCLNVILSFTILFDNWNIKFYKIFVKDGFKTTNN